MSGERGIARRIRPPHARSADCHSSRLHCSHCSGLLTSDCLKAHGVTPGTLSSTSSALNAVRSRLLDLRQLRPLHRRSAPLRSAQRSHHSRRRRIVRILRHRIQRQQLIVDLHRIDSVISSACEFTSASSARTASSFARSALAGVGDLLRRSGIGRRLARSARSICFWIDSIRATAVLSVSIASCTCMRKRELRRVAGGGGLHARIADHGEGARHRVLPGDEAHASSGPVRRPGHRGSPRRARSP